MRLVTTLITAAAVTCLASAGAEAHGGGHPTPWPVSLTVTSSYTPTTYFPTFFPSAPTGPANPATPVAPSTPSRSGPSAGPTSPSATPAGPSGPGTPAKPGPTAAPAPVPAPGAPAAAPAGPVAPNAPAAPPNGGAGAPPAAPAPPPAPGAGGAVPPIPPGGLPGAGAGPAGPVRGPAGGMHYPTSPASPSPPGVQRPAGGARPSAPSRAPRSAGERAQSWENWWHRNQWRFLEPRAAAQRTGREAHGADHTALLQQFLTQLALQDDHHEPRAAAAIALGKLQAVDAREQLERMVQQDGHRSVRESAALALGMMGAQPSAGVLHRIAADRREKTALRVYAIIGIGLLRDASGVAPLLALCEARDDREVHAAAATALGVIGDPSAIDGLLRLATASAHSRFTRAAAVTSLGKTAPGSGRHAEVLTALGRVLTTERHDDLRRAAALVLPRFADDRALPMLQRALRADGDAVVRGFAAIALAELTGAVGNRAEQQVLHGLLLQRLRLGNAVERGYAAIAIGLLGRSDQWGAVNLYGQLAGQSHASTRAAIAIGLGLCAGPEGSPILADMARNGSTDHLRGYACVALGMLGARVRDPKIGAFLTDVVRHVNIPEVRAAAALGLSKMGGSKQAVEALRTVVHSRNRYLKLSAILTLGYFRDPSTVADFVELYADEQQALPRALAVVALGHVGETHDPPVLRLISSDFNYLIAEEQLPSLKIILRLF